MVFFSLFHRLFFLEFHDMRLMDCNLKLEICHAMLCGVLLCRGLVRCKVVCCGLL